MLIKVSQQPQKPLGGSNQIWAMTSGKKDTWVTSEVTVYDSTYVATAAAGSNIPPICRYKIEGCSTDFKNMKYNSSLQSLKLQIMSSRFSVNRHLKF